MAQTIQARVNTGNPETSKTFNVTQGSGAKGKPTTIKAVKGARYHLEDPAAKNVGPENIRSKRVGKNLHVMLDGSNQADLIIEGYYDEAMQTEANRGLYGRAEDGKLYEYIPEDPSAEGMPVNLADGGKPVSQVLGGGQIGEDFVLSSLPLAAAGFNALTASAAAVGAAAAAGGGGGGGTTGGTTPLTPAQTALAKIEAYNNGNGTTPTAPTAADYADAGITGVTADNLAAVNAQVLKQATGGADTVPEVQALVTAANSALAKIEAYNNGDGTTPAALTLQDYADAGITGVTADNLAAVNAKVLAQATGGADTAPEVQALVTAAGSAIAKIEAYNNGNGTTPIALTAQDYADAGITGVTADNLAAVNANVLAQSIGGADTVPEVQALVTAANSALAKIEAYNNGNGTAPPALTLQDYADAGITGVTADNLAAVNAKVLAQATGGADTAPEVQALVTAANSALAKIEAYNNGDGTTPAALTLTDYANAGITGVTAGNLAAVNAKVLAQATGGADTAPEVQALVAAADSAIAKIEAYNNGNGTSPVALTLTDYAAAGITGVTADNLAAVNANVLAQSIGGADTVPEVQALVTAANTALAKIEAYNNGNGTTPAALTLTDYANAGITGVTAGNLAAVNAKVLAQATGGADTAPEVQALVNGLSDALAKIEAYNNGDGVSPVALTLTDYANAGITGVTAGNLAAVNAQVLKQNVGGADTVPEVQALITAANNALALIEAYNNGDGTTPAALTAQNYADAGITGVNAGNLAAVNAKVLAQTTGGADTAPEVQTLVNGVNDAFVKIEAYNNGNGTLPAALDLQDYLDAAITGVTADNLAAVNAQVLKQASGGADTQAEVQALVTAANNALAKIEAYNLGNGTTPAALTLQDYADAGIVGVTPANLAAVNASILSASPSAADTVPEIQTLVTAAENALAKIEAYNNGNGTSPAALTLQDYEAAGITGVSDDNLAALNAQVLKQSLGGADTSPEVQALVTAANSALAKIEAYNNGNGTTPAALTLQDYADAGITGVNADNLSAVNAKVLAQATGGADTVPEIQSLANAVNFALVKIEAYNNGNGILPVALTVQDYADAGITGVTADNLAAVNANVLAQSTGGADTIPEVQALVAAANSAIAKIEAYNNGNGTSPAALSTQDYANAGVTGVTADNLAAVNAKVLAQATGGADTTAEVQTLVNNTSDALAKIEAYNNGNGISPAALTLQDYAAAGITGVTADNLAAVNANVLAQSTGGADTIPEVQALVTAANSALAKIEAYNNGDGTTPAALSTQDYANAGITGVDSGNLAVINSKVLAQATGGADTVPEVQALVNGVSDALAKIEAYNNGNGTSPAALTLTDYAAAGITGVTADNLAAVNAKVLAQATGGADTVPEVQALITTANSALAKIEAYNNGDGTTPPALTLQDYADAGITGVTADNLAAVNAKVLAQTTGGADTAPEVQALVTAANTALAKIEAYNIGDGTTPAALTAQDYADAGITGVTADNLAAVNAKVLAQATGGADTAPEVQALVTAANSALAKIEAYNNGDGTTPPALTLSDYAAAGITGVTADNLAAVNAKVLAQATGGADTVPEVQALVTAANTALAKIEAYNNGDGTTPIALTAQDYADAGITGVTADNLAAVNAKVLAQATGGADTVPEVQALVTAANTALAKIEAYNNGDGTTPIALTAQDYADAGITGVTADNLAAVNAKVLAQSTGGADTVPEVQALVTASNSVLAKIEAYNNGDGTSPVALTLQDYAAAGITGVTADNLAAVNAKVLAQTTGGADTVPEVQTLVTAANSALAKIEAYNNGDGTTPVALTAQDYADAGITGVTADNLAAVNAKVLAQTTGGADTAPEVQALVTAANSALAKIEAYNNGNGTSPIALTLTDYAAAGITGVTADNLAAVNANVLAQATGGADTVPEVQALVTAANSALAKIEAYNNGNGTSPIALTLTDYADAGITGVTADNLAAVNAKVLAQTTGGADTVPEVQTLVTAANSALAKIEAYNNGDGTTPVALTAQDYADAGITGVTADNLAAVNAKVLAQATGGADTAPEVQALVTAANTALAKIEAYNNGNGTTPAALTAQDYAAAGITGVTADNLAAVNAQVLKQATGGADTAPEVQALVTAASNALAKIEAYNNGDGTTPAALTLQDYTDAGITGVTADNLAAVNAKVLAQATGGADTAPEVQALVSTAATAQLASLNAISAAAQSNDADGSTKATLTQYTDLGVTGVNTNNLAAINSALNSAAVNGAAADTTAKVQAIVNAYAAILAEANDTAATAGDGTADANSALNPTATQYAAIGANIGAAATDTENLALLNDIVGASQTADVDTVAEINELARIANAIQTVAAGNTPSPALTVADLAKIGISGVTADNLAAVVAAIAAKADDGTGTDSLSELQTIVTGINTAAADIGDKAEANTAGTLTPAEYAAAGVTGVDSTNVAAINSALNSGTTGDAVALAGISGAEANTPAKVQAIVDAYKAILAEANGAAADADVQDPSYTQYAAIGVTGVDAGAEESLLGDVIGTQASTDVDTVAKVQALADAVQHVMDGNASQAELEALGVTGVSPDNLAAVQAALAAATDATQLDSLAHLQAIVTGINDAATALGAAAEANTAGTLTPAEYAAAGVTGVDSTNVAAINSALNSGTTGDAVALAGISGAEANTPAKVQAIVDAYKAILAEANGAAADADVQDPSYTQYAAIGVTGVDAGAEESLLGDVIGSKASTDVDTVAEVQTLVDAVQRVMDVAALNSSSTFYDANTPIGSTTDTAITLLRASLQALGLTGINDQNMGAVWMGLRDSADAGTGADSLSKLQAIINAANDQPVIVGAGNITPSFAEDSTYSVQISSLVAGSVTDPDANAAIKGIAISWNQVTSAQGVWSYSTDNVNWTAMPADLSSNNTTSSLYLNASDYLRFVPTSNFNGTLNTLFFRVADETMPTTASGTRLNVSDYNKTGQSMTDGPLYLKPTITAVNDAPTGTSSTITLLEDASKTFAASDFGFADAAGESNSLSAVIITTLPVAGTLQLSGVAVTANQSIAVADLGNLVYAPAANGNGSTYARIGFKVQDNGGTSNGGVDTSTSASTLTMSVTAVNDAPTLSLTILSPIFTFTEGNGYVNNLFSGPITGIGQGDSGQFLKSFTFTVTGVADGASEVIRVHGAAVTLVDGASFDNAGTHSSVSVTGTTATVTVTPTAGVGTAWFDSIISNLAYINTNTANPTPGQRVITFTSLTDTGGTSNGGQDTATFSYASTVTVVGVNDAPVLDTTASPDLGNANTAATPSGAVGMLVSSLVSTAVTDPDGAGVSKGIALTGANSAGTVWYSTNNGTTWTQTSGGALSDSRALLLASDANTRVYFAPAGTASSGAVADAITFRAWDQTSGTAASYANIAATGNATAYSAASDTISVTVVDVTAPNAPSITSITDNVGSTTGALAAGATTDDNTPTVRFSLSGSHAVANDSIQLFNGSTAVGSAVVLSATDISNGYIDITPASALADGSYSLNAKITDVAGNVGSASASQALTIATNAAPVALLSSVSTDAFGAASNVYDSFTAGATLTTGTAAGKINGNGTFSFGSNSVVVSGNTNTVLTGNYLYIGDTSVDETVNFAFTKPVMSVTIDLTGLGELSPSTATEVFRLKVNGVDHVFTASEFSNFYSSSNGSTFTQSVVPAAYISSDGLSFGTPAGVFVKGTFTLTAAPGSAGIQSIAITNDNLTGNAGGTAYIVTATENTTTAIKATAAVSVDSLFGVNTIYSDSNGDAMRGVAITGAGTTADQSTFGKYQYSSNGGTTWTDLAAGLSDTSAKYLAKTDLVRYVAASGNTTGGKVDLIARLVDSSSLSSALVDGATIDVSGSNHGGSTAYSNGTVTLALGNHAPVLDATQSPALSAVVANTTPTGAVGDLVSSLVGSISDTDAGASQGIAITGAAAGSTVWYSLNGGTTWLSVAASSLSNTNALLLAADSDTRVYFQSAAGATTVSDALTIRAWDKTQHSTEGVFTSTAANGGALEFSTATDTVAFTARQPAAGDATINLGASGNLIAPVQVEGKWYYYWDRSGDGTSAGADTTDHNTLDAIFKYDINGNVNPLAANGTSDVYRYATINGVQVALPSINGGLPFPQGTGGAGGQTGQAGTAVSGTNTTSNNNPVFDDLLAVWDASNGTGTGTGLNGTPTGWAGNGYWSASAIAANLTSHYDMGLHTGLLVSGYNDVDASSVALEVVKTNAAPVLDAAQSPTLSAVYANTTPTGAVGDLVSSWVGGISDTDAGASKGIAITGADANATVWYSLNGGTTWLSKAGSSLSATNALLLAADSDTRVYFQSAAGATTVSSALTFRAWDQTQHITEGVLADTTATGGKSEFSSVTDTVAFTATPTAAPANVSATPSVTGGQYLGWNLSNLGDVNGDGYDDLLVSEYANWGNLPRGYVVFGQANSLAVNITAITSGGSAGFRIVGATGGDSTFGALTGIGDINGDGLADMAFAPSGGADTNTYVVYGKTNTNTVNLLSLGTQGFTLASETGLSNGYISEAGDVNGDGLADFILGQSEANSRYGRSYVVFGKTDNSSINLVTVSIGSNGFAIEGGSLPCTGYEVSDAGDVNGDGLADLLVSSSSSQDAGRSFVVFGKTSNTAVNLTALSTAGSGQGFVVTGESSGDIAAAISNAGDVNGDGLADFVVGAFRNAAGGSDSGTGQYAGRAYVVFGKTGDAPINLSDLTNASNTQGFVITGNSATDNVGFSVSAAGDFNGDGLADVVVSSSNNGHPVRAYVVFGKTNGTSINLTTLDAGIGGLRIDGGTSSSLDRFLTVTSAGDINGDGFDDLFVGSRVVAGYAGAAYVVYGGTQYSAGFVDFVGDATANTQTGTSAAETFMAGDGNDTLVGGGGADVMNGGRGNDTLVVNASNVTALQSAFGVGGNTAQLARVSGGTGFDTLRLSGANLDLTAVSNVGAATPDGLSRINSIERIDLASDTGANTLTIAARDVNDMAGFNNIHTGTASADGKTWTNVSGTALATTTKFHQVVVEGDSTDVVNLKAASGWTDAGTVSDGTSNYTVYQNTSTNSQVIVKSGVTVNQNVAPVVLDLNHDGVLSYGHSLIDVSGDGKLDYTAWAAQQDGVLVWDKLGDHVVHNASQYAFTQYGGDTDLAGLAVGFDSNRDGVFNAQDAKFAEFAVWQDANGNGVSDAGEVRSLADVGITAIKLTSDGVVRNPAAGVTEAGHTTATLADGSSMVVADAAFDYQAGAVQGSQGAYTLTGMGMSIDLDKLQAAVGHVDTLDLGTGHNTLSLNLADLLQMPAAAAQLLTVNGVAGDALELFAQGETLTSTATVVNGQSYQGFDLNRDGSLDLLVQQAVLVNMH